MDSSVAATVLLPLALRPEGYRGTGVGYMYPHAHAMIATVAPPVSHMIHPFWPRRRSLSCRLTSAWCQRMLADRPTEVVAWRVGAATDVTCNEPLPYLGGIHTDGVAVNAVDVMALCQWSPYEPFRSLVPPLSVGIILSIYGQ